MNELCVMGWAGVGMAWWPEQDRWGLGFTSGANQHAVPTPCVMLFAPVKATARADPQSPIFATKCPGDGSVMKMLWLLMSRWMMGGWRVCK